MIHPYHFRPTSPFLHWQHLLHVDTNLKFTQFSILPFFPVTFLALIDRVEKSLFSSESFILDHSGDCLVCILVICLFDEPEQGPFLVVNIHGLNTFLFKGNHLNLNLRDEVSFRRFLVLSNVGVMFTSYVTRSNTKFKLHFNWDIFLSSLLAIIVVIWPVLLLTVGAAIPLKIAASASLCIPVVGLADFTLLEIESSFFVNSVPLLFGFLDVSFPY